jgi:DNA-binding MarR family transcriptional regulator
VREDALDTIDLALGRVQKHGHKAVSTIARNVGDKWGIELSAWAFPILAELTAEPLRPSELAQRIGTTRPTMTRQLQDLESKQLIQRTRRKNDRRGVALELTARGTELAVSSRNDRRRELRLVLAAWPDDRVESLASLISDLDRDMAKGPFGATNPAT